MSIVDIASVFLPQLQGMQVDRIHLKGREVRIEARTVTASAACPGCGVAASRVHSRYARRLSDTPISGREVLIVLGVRRFACRNTSCARKTFAEPLPYLAPRYGRRTELAAELLKSVGLALGGRAGARLTDRFAIPVNRMTLIRAVRRLPDPPIETPSVLGVDDFAIRRGHRYATVLINMSTGRPIDVLPDRDADTLATWLQEHPGVQVVCRDRAGAYADGVNRGAPAATQVADRWHLLHNLSEAVAKVVTGHRRCLDQPAHHQPAQDTAAAPVVETVPPRPGTRRAANTRGRHAEIHALRQQGHSLKAIGRQLNISLNTVRKYARAPAAEALVGPNPPGRHGLLQPHHDYLTVRFGQGITATKTLYHEIRERGYRGKIRTLDRWLATLRAGQQRPPSPPPVPSTRQITGWIMRPDGKLSEDDRLALKDALTRCSDLATLTDLAQGFTDLVRQHRGHQLAQWIETAQQAPFPEIRGFAAGVRNDLDAVTAGLTLTWSSGAVEGNVNRIKMLKRQMFGRAKLDLLRKRILLA